MDLPLKLVWFNMWTPSDTLEILFYNHILSSANEIEYTCSANDAVPNFCFFWFASWCHALSQFAYIAVVTSRSRSPRFGSRIADFTLAEHSFILCSRKQALIIYKLYLGTLLTCTGNFLVLMRLWILWKCNRRLIASTLSLLLLAQALLLLFILQRGFLTIQTCNYARFKDAAF
ncbi:hypothetical protein BDN70DRAFT_891582 [Pholiota conissans]|uniref:Uncharacterized protein n=1 Tax=Pholiota conissans TaxID=109636 RepID=A0A9P5ZAN4_9AGAR|nr:hypothetical protein BDN70DRAFT_891582 [Pholiota conissans]